MADPFMGQIMQVGFSFAPVGWAICQGQQIPITQNAALYALLGVSFGGDGRTYFLLPDARSRVFVGTGQGPGLSAYTPGQSGGVEQASISTNQMPPHTHAATFTPSGGPGSASLTAKSGVPAGSLTNSPGDGSFLANTDDPVGGGSINIYAPATAGGTPVNLGGLAVTGAGGTVQVAMAGSGQPFPVLQPFLAVTTIIALLGIYPQRP